MDYELLVRFNKRTAMRVRIETTSLQRAGILARRKWPTAAVHMPHHKGFDPDVALEPQRYVERISPGAVRPTIEPLGVGVSCARSSPSQGATLWQSQSPS